MQAIETIEMNGFEIKIFQDDDAMNPRTKWGNMGKMVCFHRRYDLGDKGHHYNYPEELQAFLDESKAIYLPLYLLDHSGLSMNTGGFNCPWDSGQVGVIYVTRETIVKEYGKDTKKNREKALKYLQAEVETYNRYLQGDVYGYSVEKVNTCDKCGNCESESVDSCWGFYGIESAIEAGKEAATELFGKKVG